MAHSEQVKVMVFVFQPWGERYKTRKHTQNKCKKEKKIIIM